MHRAFWFNADAGAYWSVLDDEDYSIVELADRFLQFMRFARGRAESTTRKYAEAIALYYCFCSDRSTSWADPDITGFQMWLRVRRHRASRPDEAGMGRPGPRSCTQ
jgi:integrase/recombinase XerD